MAIMVKTLNGAIAAVSQDTARIQRAYHQLWTDNIARDKALADLTAMVREYGSSPAATGPYGSPTPTGGPRPTMQADVLDADGNLHAADIGITWEDNETFLHGVRVVGSKFSRPTGQDPVMSTPYPRGGNDDRSSSPMTTQPPISIALHRKHVKDTDRPHQSNDSTTSRLTGRRGSVTSAPSLMSTVGRKNREHCNWCPTSTRLAMNVAQELGDRDLYNYDVLVKPLGDRFDPASRVSASRFHARSRRHHEDADAFADALAELCRVGYPQSRPELRQELIAEQFVRGQSDPELKKYLWVVIRTQKDRKLQTLIEVCTDFSSLVTPTHLHRPAEQTFAVHHQAESYTEEDEDLEDVFAVGDRPPWNNRRSPDPSASPSLQQMFALACRMGYEMRPIARQPDAQRRPPGNRPSPDQSRGFRPQTRTGRDYSRIKCFSCGELGPKTGLFPSFQTGGLAPAV